MATRRFIHRQFYPTAKPDEPDPGKPLVRADTVIGPQGIRLNFMLGERYWSPEELRMLGRWLHALAGEAQDLAQNGLIDETHGYDVKVGKVVSMEADK